MNILLNSKWAKALLSKVITMGVLKKAGIEAGLNIKELSTKDDEEGVTLTLSIDIRMTKEELARLIENLM